MDAGGSRTLVSWMQARSLSIRRQAHSARFVRSGQAQFFLTSREGVEPSPSAFGETCSDPIELPQQKLQWFRQDSNLHCADSESAASAVGLLNRTLGVRELRVERRK